MMYVGGVYMSNENKNERVKAYYSYINEYQRAHSDRINILLPKGVKPVIKEAARQEGLFTKAGNPNVSAYIFKLIKEDLKNKGLLE